MKMRFNLRRGLVVELSLCLGIVLLLAFVASVAPAGAQSDCVTQCSCEINPDQSTWTIDKPDYTCVAICRILYQGKITTVYGCYKRTCTTKPIDNMCIPKTLCPNNLCEIGKTTWNPEGCQGVVTTCTAWKQIGVSYGNCDNCPK
jgi:hypothetical protein